FFFQAEDGIRDRNVTGVQTCALPICPVMLENYFWKDVLTADQKMKASSSLQSHFQALQDAKEIIVSCGSGVSACPNILALKRARSEERRVGKGWRCRMWA